MSTIGLYEYNLIRKFGTSTPARQDCYVHNAQKRGLKFGTIRQRHSHPTPNPLPRSHRQLSSTPLDFLVPGSGLH